MTIWESIAVLFTTWGIELLLLFSIIAYAIYYIKYQFSYWARRHIQYEVPSFPMGNLQGIGTQYFSGEITQRLYNKFVGKDVIAGMFFFTRPFAIILDPELIKIIAVRDFNFFVNHGIYHNKKDEPLSAHLFSLKGMSWRKLRGKLSPTFTSGKMEIMFDIVAQLALNLNSDLAFAAECDREMEFRNMFSCYGTDVIGSCAFGIECDGLVSKFDVFYQQRDRHGKLFEPPVVYATFKKVIKLLLAITFPSLAKKLRCKLTDPAISEFFIPSAETTSATLSFAMYELGRHQEIQQKVRDEIEAVLARHGGNVNYEALTEMHYLHQVINETLRMYPPLDGTPREASEDYNIPNSRHKIEKGTMVIFPIYAMQRDPRIYPNPLQFDPNRFTDEEIARRHPFAFIPFGEGPLQCIGIRFAKMLIQMGIIEVLRQYRVSHTERTLKEVKLVPSAQGLACQSDVWLKVEKIY